MDTIFNQSNLLPVRCPECNKFLFEASPEWKAHLIIKCRCGNYVEVKDSIKSPCLISAAIYTSPNSKTFQLR